MPAQSLINIGGQTVDASSVELPSTGRRFRGAWVKNGDVIEVDMAVARTIRIGQLVSEAAREADEAERHAKIFAAQGDNVSSTTKSTSARWCL